MRIAVVGPVTLSLLGEWTGRLGSQGYPFPMTAQLCHRYVGRGHDVHVVTTGQDVTYSRSVTHGNMTVTVVPARPRARDRATDFFAVERRGVAAAIQSGAPDVVHAHWTYEFALAALSLDVPRLVTVHDWAPSVLAQNRHAYWLFRAAMQVRTIVKAEHLTAPSDYLKRRVERFFRKSVEVIPNGIELSPFRAVADVASLRRGDGRRTFGMLNVGFSRRKNVQAALEGWAVAVGRLPTGSRLLLAGPGYESGGAAESWAREHGLLAGVEFVGPIDPAQVATWFKSVDVFVHTSREESFGIVLVEAMASRRPIIAGRSAGATSELLLDSRWLLDDVEDVHEIAHRIVEASRSADGDDDVLERATQRAAEYDIDRVADRYLARLGTLVQS